MNEILLRLEELVFPSIANVAVLSVDYLRYPADVPSAGRSVVLQLRVRRFACRTAERPRRTCVEQNLA